MYLTKMIKEVSGSQTISGVFFNPASCGIFDVFEKTILILYSPSLRKRNEKQNSE